MSKSFEDNLTRVVKEYQEGNIYVVNELPNYIDGLIYTVCVKYKWVDDINDLYQVAWIGVISSIKRYDFKKGEEMKMKLSTYIAKRVELEILKYNSKLHKKFYKNVCASGKMESNIKSLDTMIPGTEDLYFKDLLKDSVDVEGMVLNKLQYEELLQEVLKFKETLTSRDKIILELRLKGNTCRFIADRVGCSRQTVSNIINRKSRALKSILKREGLYNGKDN